MVAFHRLTIGRGNGLDGASNDIIKDSPSSTDFRAWPVYTFAVIIPQFDE